MTETRSRGRPRSQANYRAILDAAYALLNEEGYASAAIERIAGKAGVAKQTIYRWWPGKADLFLEVLKDKAASATDLPDSGTFERDLQLLLQQTFNAVNKELKPLMRALAVELLQDPEFAQRMREIFVDVRRANVMMLIDRERKRRGGNLTVDGQLICDLVFGTLWYRLMFEHAPLDKKAARQLSQAAMAVLEKAAEDKK